MVVILDKIRHIIDNWCQISLNWLL
jgi:hypothetical protein